MFFFLSRDARDESNINVTLKRREIIFHVNFTSGLSLRLFYKAGGIVRGRSKTSTRELEKKKRTKKKKKEQLLESALDCRAFTGTRGYMGD